MQNIAGHKLRLQMPVCGYWVGGVSDYEEKNSCVKHCICNGIRVAK